MGGLSWLPLSQAFVIVGLTPPLLLEDFACCVIGMRRLGLTVAKSTYILHSESRTAADRGRYPLLSVGVDGFPQAHSSETERVAPIIRSAPPWDLPRTTA